MFSTATRRSVLVVCAICILTACQASDASTGGVECQTTLDSILLPWATGDPKDVEAIYAEEARLILDGQVHADGRDMLASRIEGAIASEPGNTYTQVGPCAGYLHGDGDLYITSLIEVHGSGHPDGDPVPTVFRLRDGMVISHIAIDAEHY